VFVDHAVPVLAVYRGTAPDDAEAAEALAAAHRLVTAFPAYVWTASGADGTVVAQGVAEALTDAGRQPGGSLLVVEVWAPLDADPDASEDPFSRCPGFTIYTAGDGPPGLVDALCDALSGVEVAGQGADVSHVATPDVAPPGLSPLDVPAEVVGLAVDAVFWNAREGELYPHLIRHLRAAVESAVREAVADESVAVDAGDVPARTALEPAALAVDRGLSAVEEQYGFLLQVTPVNADAAWEAFQTGGCEHAPELLYRPLTFDADAVRRDLFALPIDRVEDTTVELILRECRDEIEAHVRMILDVGTPQFLPGSLRVYGAPDAALVALAREIVGWLDRQPAARTGAEVVGATAFAAAARAEIEHYGRRSAHVPQGVEVRDDITGSLMVSEGRLLVGARAQIAAARVPALLAHEVGTHVLTYANGCAQPLEQLRHGLAGYQDLQEGLAVLAEWLVGGLTPGRFRTLAARVLGADALAGGADFVETYRLVSDEAGLSSRGAFTVTLRLHRGGGLTKDMVYLRGLRDLLAHLAGGGPFWPLFVGKIALRHLGAVEDLRQRGVLRDPPLRPRYADDEAALRRLDRARSGLTVLDLLRDAG
jgi:uncharacterized protein (TIGR02421 family)